MCFLVLSVAQVGIPVEGEVGVVVESQSGGVVTIATLVQVEEVLNAVSVNNYENVAVNLGTRSVLNNEGLLHGLIARSSYVNNDYVLTFLELDVTLNGNTVNGYGYGYVLVTSVGNGYDTVSIGLANNDVTSQLLGLGRSYLLARNEDGSQCILTDLLTLFLSGSADAILFTLGIVTVRNYPFSGAFALSLEHVVPVQADVTSTGSGNGYSLSLGIVNVGDDGLLSYLGNGRNSAFNGDVVNVGPVLTLGASVATGILTRSGHSANTYLATCEVFSYLNVEDKHLLVVARFPLDSQVGYPVAFLILVVTNGGSAGDSYKVHVVESSDRSIDRLLATALVVVLHTLHVSTSLEVNNFETLGHGDPHLESRYTVVEVSLNGHKLNNNLVINILA